MGILKNKIDMAVPPENRHIHKKGNFNTPSVFQFKIEKRRLEWNTLKTAIIDIFNILFWHTEILCHNNGFFITVWAVNYSLIFPYHKNCFFRFILFIINSNFYNFAFGSYTNWWSLCSWSWCYNYLYAIILIISIINSKCFFGKQIEWKYLSLMGMTGQY